LERYSSEETIDSLRNHYQNEDPHKRVSFSKTSFYTFVLDYLSSQVNRKGKKILDVGCGYGYFLDMASKRGWEPNGVEVVQDAVKSCGKKIGYKNVFQGKLKEACLSGKSFDAITLWDVIAIVDNPYNELEECNRLLKKGGIIGIRTRNVLFQTFVYRLFNLIKRIALRFDLKEPYVFNRYCFSSKSLHILLSRIGFVNIKITNSPLTLGDPYEHSHVSGLIRAGKILIGYLAQLVSWISAGKWKIGPSLLVWAEKPK
jgi:SAM-dependent methyltransferase